MARDNIQVTGYRCRTCRNDLDIQTAVVHDICDCDEGQSNVLYLNEEFLPNWVLQNIEQVAWTRGKLICTKCQGRLGSFDFCRIRRCWCGSKPLPVVHILKDRIDHITVSRNMQCDMRFPVLKSNRVVCERPHLKCKLNTKRADDTTDSGEKCDAPVEDIQDVINRSENGTDSLTVSDNFEVCLPVNVGDISEFCDEEVIENESDGDQSWEISKSRKRSKLPFSVLTNVRDFDTTHERVNNIGTEVNVREIVKKRKRKRKKSESLLDCDEDMNSARLAEEDVTGSSAVAGDKTGVILCSKNEKLKEVKLTKKEKRLLEASQREVEEMRLTADATCVVCLDVLYKPHVLNPCRHVFCDPCLRQLPRYRHLCSPCPLCREIILSCEPDIELDRKTKEDYPQLYKAKQMLQKKSSKSQLPLPSASYNVVDWYSDHENGARAFHIGFANYIRHYSRYLTSYSCWVLFSAVFLLISIHYTE